LRSSDPTVNSYVTPLRSHVKRAICFQQTDYWGTWLFFGRGMLTSAPDSPAIEAHKVVQDHLAVQFNPHLQEIAIQAIREMEAVA
jgi:hypothetical protein